MLLRPYSFTQSVVTIPSGNMTFTDSVWLRTGYVNYVRPIRETLVETISGEMYDVNANTNDAGKLNGGILSFEILYKGATLAATQSFLIGYETIQQGKDGDLLCYDINDDNGGIPTGQFTYNVRVIEPIVRSTFNNSNSRVARMTLRFLVKGGS